MWGGDVARSATGPFLSSAFSRRFLSSAFSPPSAFSWHFLAVQPFLGLSAHGCGFERARAHRIGLDELEDVDAETWWGDAELAAVRADLPGLQQLSFLEFQLRSSVIISANVSLQKVCERRGHLSAADPLPLCARQRSLA